MDIETRLNKTEWVIEQHDNSINELRGVSRELKKSLYSIHQTLVQIKWFAVGAAVIVFANQMGLGSLFRLIGI
jgi:hypothetical protein|tara:strand:+ start:51 stop:269 length:219 start_codon:yes stop_codon:yes gene_type:complete